MAAPTDEAVKRNAIATLVKDPTNLAGMAPAYGGTELGPIRAYRWTPIEPIASHGDEAKSGRPYGGIRGARYGILSVLARAFDPALISLAFPDSPGNGDIASFDTNATAPPGSIAGHCKILAVPVVTGDHAIYLPNAMCKVREEVEILAENRSEIAILLQFEAHPDASGRTFYMAPISRLTL